MPAPKKTSASSIVKNLTKQGNAKFVGPRRASGMVAQEVLSQDPDLYRSMVPKQAPKVGPVKNRVSRTPTVGGLEFQYNNSKPSAYRTALNAGAMKNAPKRFQGQNIPGQSGMTYSEVKAAINKMSGKSRQKLRDALAEGLRRQRD
jgi:hypothetical protein